MHLLAGARTSHFEDTMHKLPQVKDVAVSESGFVFDPFSGATFSLNATGRLIVRALRDGLSREETAERLREEFGGTPDRVEDEVEEFVRLLGEFGLLRDVD